jgi:hypothetical protein
MTKASISKTLFCSLLSFVAVHNLSTAEAARARPGKAHAVGTGIVYPTLNHALIVNAAALVDSPRASLQGAYMIDPENIHASITSGGGAYGLGAGFRQQGKSSVEELGLGLKANILNLGLTARSSEFKNFDFDVGVAFDMGQFRLASVLRNVSGGVNRYDFGLGFLIHEATLEFDAKWNGNKLWLFDTALSLGNKLAVGVGYTFSMLDGKFYEGDLHAGLSAELARNISAEAFYRPHPQEWSTGDWGVGAKIVF